ncbi:hypothetical protein NDU88_002875 [Pleurodeles waltl]|uniref:Uncharacterized protein n=1 Tax=Pleurodeles waltl TaxID=8319 RepID=A0AAV7UWW9_PLEWA|nr:hypothetical protein NDU88_002875 [Pleurodeles waltl]
MAQDTRGGQPSERKEVEDGRRRGWEKKDYEANQPHETADNQDRVRPKTQMPGKTEAGEAGRPGVVQETQLGEAREREIDIYINLQKLNIVVP